MTPIPTAVRVLAFLVGSALLAGAGCVPAAGSAGASTRSVQRAAGAVPSVELRVMTFNIRYGTADEPNDRDEWPERRERVRAVIADQAPHLVGVQEALRFQLDYLLARFPAFAELGVGRDDGREAGEYSAILYRRDRFEVLDEGTFWLSDTPDAPGSTSWGNRIPRIVTWARFRDIHGAVPFYAYNTHWDHESQSSRERSAELLRAHILARDHPGDPVIVTGDFNAGEDNPAFQALVRVDAGLGLRDTFRAVRPEASDVGTFNGFTDSVRPDKIDAVLISGGWTVLDAAIVRARYDSRYPSDHFPVTARLRPPPH